MRLDPKSVPNTSSERTRLALIHTALELFGKKGFAGTSTREIAVKARVNISSIAYHFGGKDGLYKACAAFIVDTINTIAKGALLPEAADLDAATAQARLELMIDTMVTFLMIRPEAQVIVQFVLRELSQPTAALDTIYHGVFEPTHQRLCKVWQQATGEAAESERTKITVFTLIGQILYFRIGREVVKRRMVWTDIGPDEVAAVAKVAKSNLAAMLNAQRGSKK